MLIVSYCIAVNFVMAPTGTNGSLDTASSHDLPQAHRRAGTIHDHPAFLL